MESDNRLHPLQTTIAAPERFTFPFCYEPHPLCLLAAAEVQRHIGGASDWREEASRGKMFGVLVVACGNGGMAYLAAYSGLLDGRNDLPFFVPAVYDMLQPDGVFKTGEARISAVNRRIATLEAGLRDSVEMRRLNALRRDADEAVARHKEAMAQAKQRRDQRRAEGCDNSVLAAESQFMKAELRRIKQRYAAMTAEAERGVTQAETAIATLRKQRREMSDSLQRWLFSQFRMLDACGRQRDLCDIFAAETGGMPPSGAGECCAPKLLQYAYTHGLRPLCMAEFWWGGSPRDEIRHHLHYYPACRGKCKPILTHMLCGLDVDPDPLAGDGGGRLEVLYEDDTLAVVVKPAGMLSVPGRSGRRSVESIMRQRCPHADGPMIVHRLDMDTSGLLVVAKTARAHRLLQAQFRDRSVSKRYVAIVTGGRIGKAEGRISLPLRPDPLDRPRQVVDTEHGRPAVTSYRVMQTGDGITRVALYPLTGRTHQLRVHCAHPDGLGAPILGDALYGVRADRLYLHAERLEFAHPDTGRRMAFRSDADF